MGQEIEMSSSTRVIDQYLDRNLLRLGADDSRFENVVTAAESFRHWLAAHPERFSACLYSAIDPRSRPDDGVRAKAEIYLKAAWRSYAGAFSERPELVFRAMMLDAIQAMTDRDHDARVATALLLDASLPHIELGVEGEILAGFTDGLRKQIDRASEQAWSVPNDIELDDFSNESTDKVRVPTGRANVDIEALTAAIHDASGSSEAEGGNPHAPNQGKAWSDEFAPRLATALAKPLQDLGKPRNANVEATDLINLISGSVSDYVRQAVQKLAKSAYGLDLRTRLLWWKEAKVSPMTGQSYREMTADEMSLQAVFDYQAYLPASSPPSVIAFFRETLRNLLDEDSGISLEAFAQTLSSSTTIPTIQRDFGRLSENEVGPLVLALASQQASGSLEHHILFDPGLELTRVEIASIIFRELQGLKAAKAIQAVEHPEPENVLEATE